MNSRRRSVCPHDCPSVCALDIEVLDDNKIGKVYGAKSHSYTDGVICAKVSRYAERIHHEDRLLTPLKRVGEKGVGLSEYMPIDWDKALDEIAAKFQSVSAEYGAQAIWPYHYAGTMGLVQRDGLDRFRHTLGTSRQHNTFCTALSDAGWLVGIGQKNGSDVRNLVHSDVIVVWGGNPVSTQVNVMNWIAKARRQNKAKLVVVDPYKTKTADKADLHLMLRPGTDGALACAVMHVLLKENLVDQDFLDTRTDFNDAVREHLESRTPAWAASITGLDESQIIEFAKLYGSTQKSFIRAGYGFSRSRNGATAMHAVSCLPALTGAWREKGGGALYSHGSIYAIDKTLMSGLDVAHEHTRVLDQSRLGDVLAGNPKDLQGGPPVKAMLVQNTNPANVAPNTNLVLKGLSREDLFLVVHEQFMTETAAYADIILPATMFMEHNDIYQAGGHTHLQLGPQLIDAPGECRSNHQLLQSLSERLNLKHAANELSDWELVDATLKSSGYPDAKQLTEDGGIDCVVPFEEGNFLSGFKTPDGLFHFRPDWSRVGPNSEGMPSMPDHWDVIDTADEQYPLRLVAAPARQFLNTSFTETPTSQRMEKAPCVKMHPQDIKRYKLDPNELITIGNAQGQVTLALQAFEALQTGTIIVESIWPNRAFANGIGINALVSSEPGRPNGGAVFHDTAVWAKPGFATA